MSKSWGSVGAWALDSERAEAEEREHQSAADSSLAGESQSFPSLKEAAAAKPKKKKATPISLSEFTTGTYVGPGGRRDIFSDSKGLTPDEMLRLPTGPKERSPDDADYGSRLGGGFRSYGRSGTLPLRSGSRDRPDDSDGSWSARRSFGGGFDDGRRGGPPPRVSDFDQPSRADEVDNWASTKKPMSAAPPSDCARQERYGSLGGSRADEVDNWGVTKKPLPARSGGFGSGFRDSAPDFDRWSRAPSERERDRDRERPRLVLDPPRGEVVSSEPAKSRPSPFGVARPREEILAEKGLDWRKLNLETEAKKTSRPTSSHSSRPSSAQSSRPGSPPPSIQAAAAEVAAKPRPRVNPFGDAKPREVLLEEKGKDWRKIDLELERRRLERPESEEKRLKEEINHLKELMKEREVSVNGDSIPGTTEESVTLKEQIRAKENHLEQLVRDLDEKVRFGQRASDRPRSGAGRFPSFSDRIPLHSSMREEPRSSEFMERPRSRGSDVWTRSGDDRREFQSSQDGGFFSNRDIDRSKSRERW